MGQISLFDGNNKFKIDKPIRLIELFGGYGSQHFALEYLGANFEQWKLCEWAIKSIQAYKDAHFKNDNTDYSKDHSAEFILNRLAKWGISSNYNEPMTKEQIKRAFGEPKQRQIYNNIKATHNLVNIQQVSGDSLEIIETNKYCYVMTYSFPCQDLSSAGLGKGMEKGSGTRSGMLWEVERILQELKEANKELPQVLLMENVPEVIGTNNIKHFAKWVEKLEELGYKNKWEILNAKDYGVPQNRERCFMVSVLGDYYYYFPKGKKLERTLKDLLEAKVDESYYLSENKLKSIEKWKAQQKPLKDIEKEKKICPTLTARGAGEEHSGMVLINEDAYNLKQKLCNKLISENMVQEGDVVRHSYSNNRLNNGKKNMGRIESKEKLSPTLDTRCDCLGVVVDDYLGTFEYCKSENFMQGKERLKKDNNVASTIQTTHSEGIAYKNLRIRKMTPRECFRLMGVKDKDFDNIAQNQSNSSLYHLAGDSIVVDVLMAIFKEML